jgi:hypothetical protein
MREQILSQFEPEIATSLIEFGKSLSRIDADYVMFMARKSLCLYDVLVRIGIDPIERPIITDRILDLDLGAVTGKRIAIVDDALIVGTSLAKTKLLLEDRAQARVSTHVFCTDERWWCRDLIEPDTVTAHLDDPSVMTFCAGVVRALSIAPRPYIADFPFSRFIRIPEVEFPNFLSAIEWTGHNLSTSLQERHGVSTVTFFPTDEVCAELRRGIGDDIFSLIDIIKVRAFARKYENVYRVQMVPIVTLLPLRASDLRPLFEHVLLQFQGDGNDMHRIRQCANTPKAHLRVLQYALSAALGGRFFRTLAASLDDPAAGQFDTDEASLHLGPWLHAELAHIEARATGLLWEGNSCAEFHADVKPVPVPAEVMRWVQDSLPPQAAIVDPRTASASVIDEVRDERPTNLLPRLTEVFLYLYQNREIPARLEAQRLGKTVLGSSTDAAPYRDRLDNGIPWVAIADFLLPQALRGNPHPQVLTLLLDVVNDLGIAVPVTLQKDGVVLRAYRHGEDVRFADAELALTHQALTGLVDASKTPEIGKLVLEKVLVFLIQIGVARRFLEPLYGPMGTEGTVGIGFSLLGAVTMLDREYRLGEDRDLWLSSYLVDREVILLDDEKQVYTLGEKVEANHSAVDAPDFAYELGYIIGALLRTPDAKSAPLDSDALILLASCARPRDAAAALQAELTILFQWFESRKGVRRLRRIQWDDRDSLLQALSVLMASSGHQALHQFLLKARGYKAGRPRAIISACARYLEESDPGLMARTWRAYWKTLSALQPIGERKEFEPWIEEATVLAWELLACISLVEIALCARVAVLTSTTAVAEADPQVLGGDAKRDAQRLDQAIQKLQDADDRFAMLTGKHLAFVNRIQARIQKGLKSQPNDFDAKGAFNYALEQIEARKERVAHKCEDIRAAVRRFGRIYARHDYAFMLWYDIIDSTGTRAGAELRDVDEYRNDVQEYKKLVNKHFQSITHSSKKKRCEVYCYNGDYRSFNDEKHVFFRGQYARDYVEHVLEMLLESAAVFNGIRVRIMIVPCGFVGTSAYRHENETEVSGARFWEHWSRLSKRGRELESRSEENLSWLMVASESLLTKVKIPRSLRWLHTEDVDVQTEIEMLTRATRVRHGRIRFR